ncbi:MAG: GNAT family N-acetyltransferase [Myxococcota bacterium]
MDVRNALPSDVWLLVGLTRAAFAETARDLPSSILKDTPDSARQAIEQGALLAFVNARAAGAVRYEFAKDSLHFTRLAVHPACRGRGVATALVDRLEALAQTRRLHVRCSARSKRPDRRGFYLRRGYRIEGYEDVYGIAQLKTHLIKDAQT